MNILNGVTYATNSNSVLKNTYWLLALSMIPTIFGAFIGLNIGLPAITGFGILLWIAASFAFIFAIQYFKDSVIGIFILLAFTFFMGLSLTPILTKTLQYSNGAELIMLAFGGTATIFASLAAYATVTKTDFSGMGKYLFIALIVLIVAGIANIFLQLPALTILFSAVAIVIFSAYILYDVQRIVNGGETSYVSATLSLYLDVFNIFQNILNLLGIGFGED